PGLPAGSGVCPATGRGITGTHETRETRRTAGPVPSVRSLRSGRPGQPGRHTGMIAVRLAGAGELVRLLGIRREVFVTGQGVPLEREIDGLDAEALQFVALDG